MRGQKRTEKRSGDGRSGDHEHHRPVQAHARHVTGESREGLHRDHQQRGSHRGRHGQTTEQRQGGHDQETTTRADQAGDRPDDQAIEYGPSQVDRSPPLLRPDRRLLLDSHHGHGGGDHHEGEGDHQQGAREVTAQQATEEGAHHARRPEDQTGAPPNVTRTCVRDHTAQRGGTDDEQGGGDGLSRLHTGDVGQQRDHQDGPTTTEEPQREPHQNGEAHGEDE